MNARIRKVDGWWIVTLPAARYYDRTAELRDRAYPRDLYSEYRFQTWLGAIQFVCNIAAIYRIEPRARNY